METFALIILILASLIGFAAIFFTTFGTLIILLGAVLCAVLTQFTLLSWKTLLVLGILYACGEAFEYLFTILGVKRMGASNAAAVGAVLGGIIGAILGLSVLGVGVFVGTILGLFLGAFLVEWLIKKDVWQSLKAGTGSLLGRLGAIVAKVAIAIAMFVILTQQIQL